MTHTRTLHIRIQLQGRTDRTHTHIAQHIDMTTGRDAHGGVT